MPSPPVLHTFDPLLVGKVGLNIDPQPSINQVVWYTSTSASGPWVELNFAYVLAGLDGLSYVFDADPTPRYYLAKTHDTGYSAASNIVGPVTSSAGPPPPPPPPTAQQELENALGSTLNAGDQVALYPQPAVVKTVQADGSLA